MLMDVVGRCQMMSDDVSVSMCKSAIVSMCQLVRASPIFAAFLQTISNQFDAETTRSLRQINARTSALLNKAWIGLV